MNCKISIIKPPGGNGGNSLSMWAHMMCYTGYYNVFLFLLIWIKTQYEVKKVNHAASLSLLEQELAAVACLYFPLGSFCQRMSHWLALKTRRSEGFPRLSADPWFHLTHNPFWNEPWYPWWIKCWFVTRFPTLLDCSFVNIRMLTLCKERKEGHDSSVLSQSFSICQ